MEHEGHCVEVVDTNVAKQRFIAQKVQFRYNRRDVGQVWRNAPFFWSICWKPSRCSWNEIATRFGLIFIFLFPEKMPKECILTNAIQYFILGYFGTRLYPMNTCNILSLVSFHYFPCISCSLGEGKQKYKSHSQSNQFSWNQIAHLSHILFFIRVYKSHFSISSAIQWEQLSTGNQSLTSTNISKNEDFQERTFWFHYKNVTPAFLHSFFFSFFTLSFFFSLLIRSIVKIPKRDVGSSIRSKI